jgi:hypothetical protein
MAKMVAHRAAGIIIAFTRNGAAQNFGIDRSMEWREM